MAEEKDKGSDQLKHYENGSSGSYPDSHTGPNSPVCVIVPEEPPDLSPQAARALLRIVCSAYAHHTSSDTHDSEHGPGGQQNDPEKPPE